MPNDTIDVHLKGAGFTYDAKLTPGDTAEAERARKFVMFILDLAAGDPAAPPAARRSKRSRSDLPVETLTPSESEEVPL